MRRTRERQRAPSQGRPAIRPEDLIRLLRAVREGNLPVEAALERLRHLPFQALESALLDTHRALRKGFPEVVLGLGKTPEEIARLVAELARHGDRVLATRVPPSAVPLVQAQVPDARYHPEAQAVVVDRRPAGPRYPGVVVLSAGTADRPVAEEAVLTADLMDCQVTRIYDVGVAGLHRLLTALPHLERARAVVVVAGMEGALPGVVAGLVACPVIAVPTSVGYGAHLGGLAPLLTMLNACAPGVAVVNIDNGFGAGYLAGLIARAGGPAPEGEPPPPDGPSSPQDP